MKIQQIEAFLAVCKYGTFTQAAERTFTTQPTISWQITSLEKELGKQLIIRGKGIHYLTLTPEGRVFLPQAEKWLRIWQETEDLMELGGAEQYHFSCAPSMCRRLLPQIFRKLRQVKPECEILLAGKNTLDAYNEVEHGRIDCALVCELLTFDKVQILPLADEKMVFVCRKDSKYHGTQRIGSLNVEKQVFIVFSNEGRTWQKHYFGGKGKPLVSATGIEDPVMLFIDQDAWALIPVSYLDKFPDDFMVCPVDSEPPPRRLVLISQMPVRMDYFEIIRQTLIDNLCKIEGINILA